MGHLDCSDRAVGQPVANTKAVHLVVFFHENKQVGYMTFVGQPAWPTFEAGTYYLYFGCCNILCVNLYM